MGCLAVGQLTQLASSAGFPDNLAPLMAQIAIRESGGCPTAHNPGPGEDSYGLWQINVQGNPGVLAALGLSDPTQLYDPSTNAAAAAWLYAGDPNNINIAWASTVAPALQALNAGNTTVVGTGLPGATAGTVLASTTTIGGMSITTIALMGIGLIFLSELFD